ncbi:MAG: tetratricopeptide repeat protein, partial [Candidatus Eisenbacteria bacterium]
DHDGLADALGGEAQVLNSLRRDDEAISVQEEAVAILKAKGRRTEHLAYELQFLGSLYRAVGRFDLAVARAEESCDVHRETLGPDHLRTGGAMADLARCYASAGRKPAADASFRAAIGVFDRIGEAGVYLSQTLKDYADLCRDNGRFVPADRLYVRAEAALDSTQAGLRPFFAQALIGRAGLRSLQGMHAQAESLMATGFRMKQDDSPPDDASLIDAYLAWAEVRLLAGDRPAAIEHIRWAARCGAKPADVASYPKLAVLRSRADYPLAISP